MGWDDDHWGEPNDTRWAAGLRWLQSWWRETQLGMPAGPNISPHNNRPIASNLPTDASWSDAFLTAEAAVRAQQLATEHAGPGLAEAERLRRSLLTSQGVAVNAFAPLERHPVLLRRWCERATGADLSHVDGITVVYEWAPDPTLHFRSGSAFDVFLQLHHGDGRSFVAVEVKYAEHLPANAPRLRGDKYAAFTRESDSWIDGADVTLTEKATRQLWINALLAESLLRRVSEGYQQGWAVVLTCGADQDARAATAAVRRQQSEYAAVPVSWSAFEQLLDATSDEPELDAWRGDFRRRYLDLAPVAAKLSDDDARRVPADPHADARSQLTMLVVNAVAVAERVLGDGSVLDQIVTDDPDGPRSTITQLDLAAAQLETATEALKQARRDLA